MSKLGDEREWHCVRCSIYYDDEVIAPERCPNCGLPLVRQVGDDITVSLASFLRRVDRESS